ncbi:MAG: hypothetical protein ACO1QS_09705 [Verrucomicrobiota bacterium]
MFKGCFNGLAVALAAASLFFADCLPVSGQSAPVIVWKKQAAQDVVIVQGLGADILRQTAAAKWSDEQWRKTFPITVESGDLVSSVELPPMLGRYETSKTAVTFTPQYPLASGLKYRATLHLGKLPGYPGKPALVSSSHTVPAVKLIPTTTVAQVYPSADVLPENLLKFYLHFSAPMNGGHIYDHIKLLNSDGKPIELPFLEIDEELWNPEMTRLTLFIDPGRIKREVKPLEDIGPALEAGKTFTLVIDSRWQDGKGAPLKETYRKQFKVSAPDRAPLSPKTWRIKPPSAGTTDALTVDFPKAMDHALAQRLIWVTGPDKQRAAGNVTLQNQEQRWSFVPEKAWVTGYYQLQALTTIEDLAGNNIGKAFEVDIFEGVEKRIKNEAVSIPFAIKAAP